GVHVRHREAVVEEGEIELAGLKDPGNVLVVLRRCAVRAGLRVPPGGRQGGAVLGLHEAHECHLSHGDQWCANSKAARPAWEQRRSTSLLAPPATPIPPIFLAPNAPILPDAPTIA